MGTLLRFIGFGPAQAVRAWAFRALKIRSFLQFEKTERAFLNSSPPNLS